MYRVRLSICALIALVFSVSNAMLAQNNSTDDHSTMVKVQFRPKFELRDGTFQPFNKTNKVAALTSQRSRLILQHKWNNKFELNFTPQFVSIWGQEGMTQGVNYNNGFKLFESWAKVSLDSVSSFVIGRQVISLDDERFFGELDWAQGGRSHDALGYFMKFKKIDLKAYFAYNQNYHDLYGNNLSNPSGSLYNPQGGIPYKWMQTIWGKYSFDKNNSISVIGTNLGFQKADTKDDTTKTYYNQTVGLNYFGGQNDFNYNASGYYQMGKDANGKNVMGYMFAASLSKDFFSTLRLALGVDYVSGNSYGTVGTTTHSFNPYFATGHKFYGSMDYFYSGNGHGGVGIVDYYLKSTITAGTKWKWNVALHQFMSPNKIETNVDTYSKNLGQEVDIDFVLSMHKSVKVMGGYSFYITTPTIGLLKKVNEPKKLQNFAWLSIVVQPEILKF
ncbi:MAG: hypothetical protein KDC25_03920 [Saprospiraceae bacterium]|nr:hypothetical protein [Saprospiraceae bacterium]